MRHRLHAECPNSSRILRRDAVPRAPSCSSICCRGTPESRLMPSGSPTRSERALHALRARATIVFVRRALACLILVTYAAKVDAQQGDDRRTLVEALRLRDAGDLAGAGRLLRRFVDQHPDDGEGVRALAQVLYWQKDLVGARQLYEEGVSRHPGDATLRLDYGQMLLETRQDARLSQIVTPLLDVPGARGRAHAMLGTAAYWRGDLSTAKRELEFALHADSSLGSVRHVLDEIGAVTSPWLRLSSQYRHDNQPIDRPSGEMETGWYATPSTPLFVSLGGSRATSGDSLSLTLLRGQVGLRHAMPNEHLDLELGAGAIQRSGDIGTDWTGRAVVGIRLPADLRLRLGGERDAYLYTTASLATPVMTQSARASLALENPRGWLGEAVAELQHFADNNAARTAYAWLLAPIARSTGGVLQLGYSFAAQDADHSRWVLAYPNQPFPVTSPNFRFDGRYAPYYTPLNLVQHSALAAGSLNLTSHATLRVGGAYAIHATDDAPVFAANLSSAPPALVSTTWHRTFSPWNARGSLDFTTTPAWTITFAAEMTRTVFYRASDVRLQVSHRFEHRITEPARR